MLADRVTAMWRRRKRTFLVDAPALSSAPRLPACCTRHGRPAVQRSELAILSRPPRTGLTDGFAGVVGIAAAVHRAAAATKVTRVTNWPVCRACVRRRRGFQIATRVMFWSGLIGFAGGLLTGLAVRLLTGDYADSLLLAPILVGFGLLLGAAIPLTVGRPDRIGQVETTPDGRAVRFTDPDPEFDRQMRQLFGDRWLAGAAS